MNTINDRSDDEQGPVPPSDDVRAGEYVLGVLDAEGRREVQARMSRDAQFARRVEAWEQHLSPWLLRAGDVEPSAHVWPRIRTRLGWSPITNARSGIWNNTAFWRTATALAVAAGVAAVVIGLRPPGSPPIAPPIAVQPPVAPAHPVTVLARDDGSTGWIASIDSARGTVLMVPVPSSADAGGLVNELWVIPAGGAPLSLGEVSGDQAHTIVVPAAIRSALIKGATLAVTLEPRAGMPHAAPSGPIVAKGGIERI